MINIEIFHYPESKNRVGDEVPAHYEIRINGSYLPFSSVPHDKTDEDKSVAQRDIVRIQRAVYEALLKAGHDVSRELVIRELEPTS